MANPLRLLILNDNAEVAERLADNLGTDSVVAYATSDSDEACQLISLLQHDVLLLDIEKLIRTPVNPLGAFRQAKPDLKIVGISRGQRGDTGLLVGLLDLDANIREPVTPEILIIEDDVIIAGTSPRQIVDTIEKLFLHPPVEAISIDDPALIP